MIESIGYNSWLLRYDSDPKWLPAPDTIEQAADTAYVTLRKDFIEKFCTEVK